LVTRAKADRYIVFRLIQKDNLADYWPQLYAMIWINLAKLKVTISAARNVGIGP
jgi:hypothetical protein